MASLNNCVDLLIIIALLFKNSSINSSKGLYYMDTHIDWRNYIDQVQKNTIYTIRAYHYNNFSSLQNNK